MIKYIKNFLYLYVLIGFSASNAGSFEDYFTAIEQDNVAVVQNLLQRGFDPNTPNENSQTGLFLAIRPQPSKVAELLATWPKTQFDARNLHDETPLMLAALHNQLGLTELLLARGADVNKPGWTPLHYAATKGHIQIMRLLLEHHAYIDALSPNGTTPLMMAAHYGTAQATKLLLEEGADPTLVNQLGLSALDFARRAQNNDAAAYIEAFQKAWKQQNPSSTTTP